MTSVGRLAGALAVTVLVGLLSRAWTTGFFVWDKVVGDALYAVAVYLVIAIGATLARRPWQPPALGAIAVALCWAIEAFQATGFTARHVSPSSLRHVLGTGFAFTDLIWYLLGVIVIAVIDERWRRRPATVPVDR